jgi:hypothetical protein
MGSLYKQEVSKYGKKDAIIAICLFAYWIILPFAVVAIRTILDISEEAWLIPSIVIAFVNIAIVLAIVLIRKQGLKSIGLHKTKFGSAISLGLLFAFIPLLLRGVVPGLFNDWELNPPDSLMLIFASTALMAVREDITFVGFIQTRLYGLVKNDNWAIYLGAALFTLAHVPQHVQMGIPQGAFNFIIALVFYFFMHRAFIMVFKKNFSLVSIFIIHTATNFSGRIWSEQEDGHVVGLVIAALAFIFAVEVWHWYGNRSNKKQEKENESIALE